MAATAKQIQAAIDRVLKAREEVLRRRNTDAIIGALAQTTRNWLEPDNPWRQRAVEQAPSVTGFSDAMVAEAIDLTFGTITEEALGELLDGELGDRRVLDGFVASPKTGRPAPRGARTTSKQAAGTAAPTSHIRRALGPQLIAHFLAGNVPAPGIVSICCGLLLKSANLVKVSNRDPVFPSLLVESLRAVDAELADCVAILDWRREEVTLTQAALAKADAVIAYGDEETISTLRRMCQPGARFLGYGHKLSFAVVAREALTADNLPSLADAAAFDVSVYDQQGCLSPHVFYVEQAGQLSPREFAEALAKAMAAYQSRVPCGELSVEEAAQIAKLRGAYEFRSASDKSVAIWASADANDPPSPNDKLRRAGWLVIYEEDPMFTPSCLNRVVFVKPVDRLDRVPELVRKFAPHLSTVGIAPSDARAMTFASGLARLGVSRICPIGQMQRPRLSWRHDGRPNLADLVRWMDAE